jgi:hypothetical protein
MKSATGLAIAVTALAWLGSTAVISPAGAYECKPRVTAASGYSRTLPTPPKVLRHKACSRARSKWSALVAQRYGSRFANWAASDSRRETPGVTATHFTCEVSAKPCTPLE